MYINLNEDKKSIRYSELELLNYVKEQNEVRDIEDQVNIPAIITPDFMNLNFGFSGSWWSEYALYKVEF